MSGEIWFMKYAPVAVPCPECGGRVWFGSDFDWPPDRGGNYLGDRCACEGCKREWTADDAPENFTTKDGECWNVNLEDAT